MGILYLVIAFILNAAANVLFKAQAGRGIVLHGSIGHIIASNWAMILGLVFFAINAIFYILALRTLPLAVAYPGMVVMSLILVMTASVVLFQEKIGLMQGVGYALLIIAIFIIFSHGA